MCSTARPSYLETEQLLFAFYLIACQHYERVSQYAPADALSRLATIQPICKILRDTCASGTNLFKDTKSHDLYMN